MGGIAGVVRFDGRPAGLEHLANMTSMMAYRGPDSISHWVDGATALGYCQLCTTPESLSESQPVASECGSLILVMDGRIDNGSELRKELLARDQVLRNRSDAELVLHAYQIWGENCLRHLEGDFALAIWNTKSQTLFCARDPMGNKPFNYYWDGQIFAFASDVMPILQLPWVARKPNEYMLAQYLGLHWLSLEDTCWDGVRRLPQSHQLSLKASGITVSEYWRPQFLKDPLYQNEQDYIDHYQALLTKLVRQHSRSHRPVSAEVSGGLDSSAIFCVGRDLRRKDQLLAPDLHGYTLDFSSVPGADEADELDYARAVAGHTGSSIEEVAPTIVPLAWYRELANQTGELPSYANAVMHKGLLDKAAATGSRVMLNGVGGDEWLDPYPYYYADYLSCGNLGVLLRMLGEDAKALGIASALNDLLRYGVRPLAPNKLQQLIRRISTKRQCRYLSDHLHALLEERREQSITFSENLSPSQQRSVATWMSPGGVWASESMERLAATAHMEYRKPFWNKEMCQFMCRVPGTLLASKGLGKYLHRQAMKGVLPEYVRGRHIGKMLKH